MRFSSVDLCGSAGLFAIRTALLSIGAFALLFGCGETPSLVSTTPAPDDSSIPEVRKLNLLPAPVEGRDRGSPSRNLVEHHEVLASLDLWGLQRSGEKVVLLGETDALNLLSLSETATRLGIRGSFHLSRFQEVAVDVEVAAGTSGTLTVFCQRRGRVLARSRAQELSPGTFRIRVSLAPASGRKKEGGLEGDKLGLSLRGKGEVRVHALALYRTGSGSADVGESESGFIVADGQARRGRWLFSSEILRARALVGEGGRLQFSYCPPPRLEGVESELQVSLVSTEGQKIETYPLSAVEKGSRELQTVGWRRQSVDLSGFIGQELEVRFSLRVPEKDGPPFACPIAEVEIDRPRENPPTVLLVTSDTHRADHLGRAERGVEIHTPFLDRLAGRGVLFEDCLSPANITAPSHISLLTGTHLRDHRILDNRTPLSRAALTLAEVFRRAGYSTFASVSAPFLRPQVSGLGQGFDRVAFPSFVGPTREAANTIGVLEGWLDDAADRPLFVWVHLFDAHLPYEPPSGYSNRYYPEGRDPRDPKLPDPGVPEGVLPRDLDGVRDLDYGRAQYRAEITSLDDALGELVESSRFGEGIIAFTADHGECLGEREIYFSHGGLYPPNLQIPLVLAWPDGPAGVRCEDPVRLLDVGKTLASLAGVEAPEFPGRDLSRLVAGAGASGKSRGGASLVRFAIQAGGRGAAVVEGRHHFVLHLEANHPLHGVHANPKHSKELYDFVADPQCEKNLLEDLPEVAARLEGLLIEWLRASVDRKWAGRGIQDPVLLRKLKALGYHTTDSQEEEFEWWPLEGSPEANSSSTETEKRSRPVGTGKSKAGE